MSTLKTHNLQSPDAGSVNIFMTPNAGVVVTGITTVGAGITLSPDGHAFISGIATVGRQIVGISTNKLPPRGPVGLNQLVSYKYQISSNGRIRK